MSTILFWIIIIIIAAVIGSGIFIGKAILRRIRRRYWELNREILLAQQQVSQVQQQVSQVQQQVSQVQQQVSQVQQQVSQVQQQVSQAETQSQQQFKQIQQSINRLQQDIVLEHLSDLVRLSEDSAHIDHEASQKMLKHIWELKEDNSAGESPI